MTEAEWLECNDPARMLNYLQGKTSDRKLRLFAVGCCRLIWHLLKQDRSRRTIESAEQFAEGMVAENEAQLIVQSAIAQLDEVGREINKDTPTEVVVARLEAYAALDCCRKAAKNAAIQAQDRTEKLEAFCALLPFGDEALKAGISAYASTKETSKALQCRLLRCVFGRFFRSDLFGNPFRPGNLDPKYRTPSAQQLAQAIYDDRSFDRLPILADLLQEAGCQQEELLQHLRGGGEHVRGCWALDLILGKE